MSGVLPEMSASRQRCAYAWNTEICSQQLLDAIVHERSLMTWTSVYWRRKSTQRVSHRFDDGQDRRLWAEDVEGSKSIEFSGPRFSSQESELSRMASGCISPSSVSMD